MSEATSKPEPTSIEPSRGSDPSSVWLEWVTKDERVLLAVRFEELKGKLQHPQAEEVLREIEELMGWELRRTL